MEEKVLIKSERYSIKKLFVIMAIIGVILSAAMLLSCVSSYIDTYDYWYEKCVEHVMKGDCGYLYESWELCHACEVVMHNHDKLDWALSATFRNDLYIAIPVVALSVVGGLIYLWLRSYELTVTDKRIYGKVAWGKRVDLPVDAVSAIATIRALKGVSVATSSGKISFRIIKNAEEIYKVMNNLLIERQQEKRNATVTTTVLKSDEADQIQKYKDLLDGGVITQEEFNAKKKQLLGL